MYFIYFINTYSFFYNIIFSLEMMGNNDAEMSDTLIQHMSSCLASMDIFLQQPYPVLASSMLAENHKTGNKADLVATIANIFGIKNVNSVNPNDTLDDLGVDSLMSMEIKQILKKNYDILLATQEICDLSFAKLQELSSISD